MFYLLQNFQIDMVRFSLQLLIVFLIVFFIGAYITFWLLMIIVGLSSFFLGSRGALAFFASGLGFGLGWVVKALVISINTNSKLQVQMAELMGVSNENLLFAGTFVVGFLLGAFSGMTGASFKKIFERRDSLVYRS